ncbi:OPT oligopeptide transporter [Colletotrichum scovillei]|uniref:OPT oligopeptide transporter n=1 Tax=Colletotrichum scovillei TaxID=1209932 RepID=A0A9P7U855_9PEZI|nr:OPT oligopeptide transporter [Colletotrichum scovillei]KAF4778231.1 OPT oligopeptide transporter [Colletotrichum scovillei]KAG7043918.1 OPT oligopeptide transporter [Colletotrichum scovillei]KAG7046018.1 OPT oligopeptide transporter [Colletotrichum scovillei]KAG7063367.1 OPT oligopeptide transporter [Colletotrichum scovillei]
MSQRRASGHKSKPKAPFPPDPDADTVALALEPLPLLAPADGPTNDSTAAAEADVANPSTTSSSVQTASDPYNTARHHRSRPSTLRSRPSTVSHVSSAGEYGDDTIEPNPQSPVPHLDDGTMPSKPSLLRSSRDDAPSYGAVSQDPSRNVSPTGSDSRTGNAHPMRYVSDTTRSASSRFSTASRRESSRLSEELDAAALTTGLEGRFGVTQAPVTTNMLEDAKSDAAEDEVDYDDYTGSEPDEDPADNSPHEVVRASVPPTDNITLSINTPRMWTLSFLFSVLGSSTNLFFSLRYPSVAITPVIALLLVHPLGLMWDYLLKYHSDPAEEFLDGVLQTDAVNRPPAKRSVTRFRRWLAQGRWNEKEHTCVYVSSNVSFGFAFATDVIVEQSRFYHQEATITYQILLILSTQILGYAFAGLTRRFLVRPSGMIWPGTLMSAAMFGTLHKEENRIADGWRISRWKFFYLVWFGGFVFYFLPGLLMPCLSYFNVITWFAPKNVVVANLFGTVSGLGLFPLTFDWAQVTYIGSPLLVPFWAAMNVIGGLVIVMWLIAPIAYYANVFYSSYMPILSSAVFDNKGKVYDVSKILTSEFLFDRDAYSKYSRVFLPITYVLSYGVQFAALAALLTHTVCWHGKDMWNTWKTAMAEARNEGQAVYQPVSGSSEHIRPQRSFSSHGGLSRSSSNLEGMMFREDVHCRLMKRYKDAPLSWYLATFVSMLAVGIFVVEYYPIHLPWYGLLMSLGICAIFFIPNGIIMAVTNQHSSIYLICQLICGAVFPGRPIANMVFVTYGYISSAQGIKFASDLKLGHYMKIPPRIMFSVQMVATIVSSLTQIGVLNWMFANVKGICTPEAVNGFTCPIARVHFNGSILWGVVGPGEFFGPNATYRGLVWCFLIGAIAPIPLWLYARKNRHSILRKINLPVVFGSMAWIPPATGLNFSVWAVVCYVFNYLVKRRKSAWWAKYTMTMSAALDSSLAFGIVVVFFGFVYPGHMKGFKWWGTEVYKQGCDWQACSYNTVPEGGHFGPDKW